MKTAGVLLIFATIIAASLGNSHPEVTLHLYTKAGEDPAKLFLNDGGESITNSNFDPQHPTRIIISSYSGLSGMLDHVIRDAYYSIGVFNIIEVIWEAGYKDSSKGLASIGNQIAQLVRLLESTIYVKRQHISLIGFSVGAQVAGYAGRQLKKEERPTLGSIIGLNPRIYEDVGQVEKLNQGDALYVQIINTDNKNSSFATAHSEFYPNYGAYQPGCSKIPSCPHLRSILYFAESLVRPSDYWSTQCRNKNEVINGTCISTGHFGKMGGEPLDKGTKGVFYLKPRVVAKWEKLLFKLGGLEV